MKVKIIKNAPVDSYASNISRYIGQIFEVESPDTNGNIIVDEMGALTVYKGEYEIINEDNKNEDKDINEDPGYQAFSNLMDMVFELAEELHDKIDNDEGLTDVEFRFLDALDDYVNIMSEDEE